MKSEDVFHLLNIVKEMNRHKLHSKGDDISSQAVEKNNSRHTVTIYLTSHELHRIITKDFQD
jgi:hypothetical protein